METLRAARAFPANARGVFDIMYMPLLLTALAAAPVPKLSAGPDIADTATPLEAPIVQVTVFSDRATVRREARLALSESTATVQLPDLPGNIVPESVRVSARGAEVWRIEVAPVDRERVSIAQADTWLEQLDTLSDDVARIDAKVSSVDFKLQLLAGITPAPPVPEAQREGRPRAALAPSIWERALTFLSEQRTAARAARRELLEEREEKQEALLAIQREVGRLDQGGFSNRRQQVIVILRKTKAASATIGLEYTVPGASWRPAYDLTYLASKNQVVLETSARVTQASGEAWEDVELLLSTAIPGADIALPKLLTWTLGEAKEFIPQPRPREALPQPQVYPQPTPVASARDRERAEMLARLRQRLALVGQVTGKKDVTYDFGDDAVSGDLGGAPPVKRAPAPRRSLPRPEPRSSSSESIADESFGSVARNAAPVTLRSSASVGTRRGLALYERPPPGRPRLADATLPAMLAGGFDYVYEAQTRAMVPSDGSEVRVPLASDRYPVQAYYEATPSLAKTAYLEAKIVNDKPRPILGGPLTIFVGDEFSGDGKLETTGAGGEIELPLGADEDVKVERTIVPNTETDGVIVREDVTRYRVMMEVANFKKTKIRVGVMEPLPKSHNEDIEIRLLSSDPPQSMGPDEQGLLRWNLDLAPGTKKTIELVYEIERPENWRLHQ